MKINKKQQTEEIVYPMAKESTTVGGVLKRLRLTKGVAMHRQLKAGQTTVNGTPARNSYQRVGNGDVVGWHELRISITNDEAAKATRLTQELMRSGGFRGSMGSQMHGGGSMPGGGGGK